MHNCWCSAGLCLATTLTHSLPIRFFLALLQLDGLIRCTNLDCCSIHAAAATTTNQQLLSILVSCQTGTRSGWTETKVLDDVDSTNHTCGSSSSAPWSGPMNMSCPSGFIQDRKMRRQDGGQAYTHNRLLVETVTNTRKDTASTVYRQNQSVNQYYICLSTTCLSHLAIIKRCH